MQPEVAILGAVALIIGVPSAWRNPTAAALVISWCASVGLYLITGESLAVELYAFPDIFVLAVIMAKKEYCNLRPYRNIIHQLKCVLLERSPADRFIMLSYLAVWPLYVAPIHPYYQYWGLWWIAVFQFLAASSESLEIFWKERAMRKCVSESADRDSVVLPFPFQRRLAEAVRIAPDRSGHLIAQGGGGSG